MRQGSGIALLALDWGPPGGLVVAGWFAALEADRPVALIDTLLVAPDDRRRGIGRLLLKAASQAARSAGCGEIRLLTVPGDPTMAAFAAAAGFEDAGHLLARPLRKRT